MFAQVRTRKTITDVDERLATLEKQVSTFKKLFGVTILITGVIVLMAFTPLNQTFMDTEELRLLAPDGSVAARLTAESGTAELTFIDPRGEATRLALGVGEDGAPYIRFLDEAGDATWRAGGGRNTRR